MTETELVAYKLSELKRAVEELEEDHEDIATVKYRIQNLEANVNMLLMAEKTTGQLLCKLRLDEEELSKLKVDVANLSHARDTADKKQDKRLKDIEDMVNHLKPAGSFFNKLQDRWMSLLITGIVMASGLAILHEFTQ